MPTLDDMVEITLKGELPFMAIKLEIPDIAGISDKIMIHVLRLNTFERELIPLKNIETINGEVISKPRTEWRVKNNKGKEYVVTLNGSGYTCTCIGYRYNRKCKHINEVRDHE